MSELLTRLESVPTIRRNDSHDHHDCHHPDGTSHVAEMVVLSSAIQGDELTEPSQVPESIADLDLYDIVDSDAALALELTHPFIVVTSTDGLIDTAIVKLRDVAGDLILTNADQERRDVIEFERPQAKPFDRRYFCPPGVTQLKFRSLVRQLEPAAVEAWLNLPLQSLGGKTALEAASDESLKARLSASLLVMLSIASRFDQAPDLNSLRQRLNLPARQKREVPANAAIAAVPALQYERLDIGSLSDSQLQEFTNRCSVLGLRDQVRSGLDEIIRRPSALKDFSPRRAYLMRAAIARVEEQRDLTFECLEKARESVEPGAEAFRVHLELDIRELSYRLDEPSDEQLKPLLHKFRDRYLHKIPEIESVIIEQLEHAGCPELANELEGGLAAVSTNSGGLWTPDADAGPGQGGSLWIPGQE
jgi:hypothetical protein